MSLRSAFTEAELRYLQDGTLRLGRLATVGRDGTPHVVPTGWRYNVAEDTIDVTGNSLQTTAKFKNVARSGRAAIVIDDLAGTDPWAPRAVEVRGRGEAVDGAQPLLRIHPDRIVSWGLDGDPGAGS